MQTRPKTPPPDRRPVNLLRRAEVKARIGITSNSQLYRLMGRGDFPRPVKLSERSVAWPEHEVQAWIEQRIAARDEQRKEG